MHLEVWGGRGRECPGDREGRVGDGECLEVTIHNYLPVNVASYCLT